MKQQQLAAEYWGHTWEITIYILIRTVSLTLLLSASLQIKRLFK